MLEKRRVPDAKKQSSILGPLGLSALPAWTNLFFRRGRLPTTFCHFLLTTARGAIFKRALQRRPMGGATGCCVLGLLAACLPYPWARSGLPLACGGAQEIARPFWAGALDP